MIKAAVKKNTCKGAVMEKWILRVMPSCPIKFVAVESHKKYPSGFLMARFEDDSLYVELVCSNTKGVGTLLINEAIALADSQNVDVALSSLPAVMGVYAKHGFQLRKSCSAKPVSLPKTMPKYATVADVYNDPDMVKFMVKLTKNGLSSVPQCASLDIGNAPDGGKKKFKENTCGIDGFRMMRCRSK